MTLPQLRILRLIEAKHTEPFGGGLSFKETYRGPNKRVCDALISKGFVFNKYGRWLYLTGAGREALKGAK